MASLFGDDGIEDLFNDNIQNDNELPDLADGDDPGTENLGNDGEDANAASDANAVKVEPKKRIARTRIKLSVDTLSGPRGIHTIENYFKDIKFKGKGYEKQDLDDVLKRLQHWGHRMYPNYTFDDLLTNIERLGKKKPLHVHMSRYRLGMLENITTNGNEIIEEDEAAPHNIDEPFDEFDALLDEQIAISRLAPQTPGSTMGAAVATPGSSLATPSFRRDNAIMSTPYSGVYPLDTSDLATALPSSQPSTPQQQPAPAQLTSEQLARIAENRRLAQERLRAKKLEQEKQLSGLEGPTEEI